MSNQKSEVESQEKETKPIYKLAGASSFKFGKSYLVKDAITSEISEYVPKEGSSLSQQAVKFDGFVARGAVVVEDKKATQA